MQHGPGDGDALSSLLSMLNNKEPGSSITSVISATTIDLLCNLLRLEDHISVTTRLSENSDVLNLLDFILHLLRDRRLTSPDATTDYNRGARRLMFKIISTIPVIPQSLILTEVKVPAKRDYIGGGAFGGVFKGELCGEIVGLKVLYRTGDNVAFCREALMWAMLKHDFVLSFLGIYKQQNEMFLVSPYMENGTLAQWRKNAKPSIAQTCQRILEVAQGMEYIHSEGIVHGDLRGENVLLDAKFHVQIADFGLTRILDATNTRSGAKHVNFSAPELFGCLDDADNLSAVEPARTQMSDVYAFGCLHYEIYHDSIPFAGRLEGQIIHLAIRGVLPARLDEPPLSDGAWEIIQRCWAREPWERPRMKDIIDLIDGQRNLDDTPSLSQTILLKRQSAPSQPFCDDQPVIVSDSRSDISSTSSARSSLTVITPTPIITYTLAHSLLSPPDILAFRTPGSSFANLPLNPPSRSAISTRPDSQPVMVSDPKSDISSTSSTTSSLAAMTPKLIFTYILTSSPTHSSSPSPTHSSSPSPTSSSPDTLAFRTAGSSFTDQLSNPPSRSLTSTLPAPFLPAASRRALSLGKSARLNAAVAGEPYESDGEGAKQKEQEKKNKTRTNGRSHSYTSGMDVRPLEGRFKGFGPFENSGSGEAENRVILTENAGEDDEHDRVLPSPSFGPAGGWSTLGASSANFPHDELGGVGGGKETSYPSHRELKRNFGQGTKYKDYSGDSDAEDGDEPSYSFDQDYSDLDRPPVVDSSLPPGSYRALHVFEAVGDTEMGLEEGQIVTVIGKERGDGWAVVNDTREGREGCHALVPESYLELDQLAD